MAEIDDLLVELKAERDKYTKSDKVKMKKICDRLVELGEYPAKSNTGYDSLVMVESYGVDWHIFREPLNCRHCNADLRDHKHGPPGKREIGIYDQERDMTVAFMCPDCGKNIWMTPTMQYGI